MELLGLYDEEEKSESWESNSETYIKKSKMTEEDIKRDLDTAKEASKKEVAKDPLLSQTKSQQS